MKVYKENLIAVLTQLGIAIPDYITMDQKQITRMIAAIETALDTYDPAPPGNALVTDVLAGKTFSTAAGLGLTGTLTLADLTADADATDADILPGKTAYVNGQLVTGALQFTQLPEPTLAVLRGNRLGIGEAVALVMLGLAEVEVYVDETLEDTLDEAGLLLFNLTDYITEEPLKVAVVMVPADGVTLAASDVDEVTFGTAAITRNLTDLTDSNEQSYVLKGVGIEGTLTPTDGNLPTTIVVEVNSSAVIENTDYSYNSTTGEYYIYDAAVTGPVNITAVADI